MAWHWRGRGESCPSFLLLHARYRQLCFHVTMHLQRAFFWLAPWSGSPPLQLAAGLPCDASLLPATIPAAASSTASESLSPAAWSVQRVPLPPKTILHRVIPCHPTPPH